MRFNAMPHGERIPNNYDVFRRQGVKPEPRRTLTKEEVTKFVEMLGGGEECPSSDNTPEPNIPLLSLEPVSPVKATLGYSLADFKHTEASQIDYIGGMFPKGKVSALVGESGKGKGWVIPAVALSVTDGKKFLPTDNYDPKTNGKVLLIDTEGRIATYVQRIKELGGSIDNFFTPTDPLRILRYSAFEDKEIIEKVIMTDTPEFVIIDSFAGFSDVDENTCNVLPCLKWFTRLALQSSSAIVFTQLVNKTELKDGKLTSKSVRGFSGIHQFPEIIWAIDTPDSSNDKIKRLYQVKNNVAQKHNQDYTFILEDSTIKFTEARVKSNFEVSRIRQDILEMNRGRTPQEIALMIQETEPETKLNTLLQWVLRNLK